MVEKGIYEPLETKRKLRYLVAALSLLLFLAAFTNVISYNMGYNKAYNSGYNIGFEEGYALGNATGFDSGHDMGYRSGYDFGNKTGYSEGYGIGYNIGYDEGYNVGYDDGYAAGYNTGYDEGYSKGYREGFAATGFIIRDPTYEEAIQFMYLDDTDKHEYSENYTCLNFAADFKSNAFKAGYRCGFVRIEFPDAAHAIVCFNTTDRGLIFIEPQYDDIVALAIGESYSSLNGYEGPASYDDTIIRYIIIW